MDFCAEETVIFDDIRSVLDEQVERVSALEREILYWMALEREPVSVRQLQNDLLHRAFISTIVGSAPPSPALFAGRTRCCVTDAARLRPNSDLVCRTWCWSI